MRVIPKIQDNCKYGEFICHHEECIEKLRLQLLLERKKKMLTVQSLATIVRLRIERV